MKKKKILSIILVVIGLIMISIAIFFTIRKEEISPTPSNEISEEELYEKAMVYIGNEYHYTTTNYIIDLALQKDVIIANVKSQEDGTSVEDISIEIEVLKKWDPNKSTSKITKPIEASDGFQAES